MKKGQIQNLTGFGLGLLICGIVLGLTAVVLANFNTSAAPDQSVIVTNATSVSGTLPLATQAPDLFVLLADPTYGTFINGSLSFVVDNNSRTDANLTVKVNSNVIGTTYGTNTSGTKTYLLTAAQLLNDKNNVSYTTGNTTHVTSTSLTFVFDTWGGVQTTNTVTDVINSVTNVSNWIPIIIIVVVVSFILLIFGMGIGRREA